MAAAVATRARSIHEHINGVKESQAQVPAQSLDVDTCTASAQQLSTSGNVALFSEHTTEMCVVHRVPEREVVVHTHDVADAPCCVFVAVYATR